MTKKEYLEKNKWKTIFHKYNLYNNEKYTICEKWFLKNEIGGEND